MFIFIFMQENLSHKKQILRENIAINWNLVILIYLYLKHNNCNTIYINKFYLTLLFMPINTTL